MTNKRIDKYNFTPEQIEKVWEKGEIVSGFDARLIRKDKCGALIKRDQYKLAKDALSMAWEIDYIKPQELGGTNDMNNLQPLQWKNNRHKENNYPSWSCSVCSEQNKNQLIDQ
jgi:hypothetical protein